MQHLYFGGTVEFMRQASPAQGRKLKSKEAPQSCGKQLKRVRKAGICLPEDELGVFPLRTVSVGSCQLSLGTVALKVETSLRTPLLFCLWCQRDG